MKHVTIKDIALHLNISTSTVSRALANDKNIRRETRERILQAARELGYRPNLVAKNLKAGHSNCVGVIVPEMVTPFASKVVDGIQSILYPLGTKVIVADSHEDSHRELTNLTMMEDFMVDGIIISVCDYMHNRTTFERLQAAGMPMVFYDRIPHGLNVAQVIVDDYMKSFFLTDRLIDSGRRNIVHICGPERIYNAKERAKGFREAMQKYGLEAGAVIEAGMTFEAGAEAADRIIDSRIPCDAIFAFSDIQAIGAMNRLRERGKKIPEEIAVASFSGTELSTVVYPQLTTVEAPLEAMGRQAAELLMELIDNPDAPHRSVVMNADIVMRASTGR